MRKDNGFYFQQGVRTFASLPSASFRAWDNLLFSASSVDTATVRFASSISNASTLPKSCCREDSAAFPVSSRALKDEWLRAVGSEHKACR